MTSGTKTALGSGAHADRARTFSLNGGPSAGASRRTPFQCCCEASRPLAFRRDALEVAAMLWRTCEASHVLIVTCASGKPLHVSGKEPNHGQTLKPNSRMLMDI